MSGGQRITRHTARRMALFADLHGNPYACEAVLEAISEGDGELVRGDDNGYYFSGKNRCGDTTGSIAEAGSDDDFPDLESLSLAKGVNN